MTRRSLLFAVSILSLGASSGAGLACRRAPASSRERCPHCGMLVDPKSAFRTEVVRDGKTIGFDTPRCALRDLKAKGGAINVQEFYTRGRAEGDGVRFVAGSDVEGPMGAELVPVSPDKVEKFMKDHRGARAYRLDEITPAVLTSEGAP